MTNTPEPTTYHALSQIDPTAEAGGRFASPKPYVVGQSPTTADAPAPSAIPWNDGTEPSMGTDIETVDQMNFVSHGGLANGPPPGPAVECPYQTDGGCTLEINGLGPCVCFHMMGPR
jgi:hypothetical protein